jgi:tetratricopeptide (TPR) repeat protein
MPLWQRGQCYTRAQQWKEAAEDFRQAIALGAPLEPPQSTGIGALLLFQHHRDAYLQAARQEVSRLRSNEWGTFDWQALRVCMLDAQNALSIDWNEIATAAHKALNADPQARSGDRPRREGPPRESSQGGFFEGPPPRDRRPRELFEGPPQRDRHPEDPKDGPPPHHHPPGEGPDGPRGLRGVPNGMRLPIAVRQYLTGIAMLRAHRYGEAAELLQLAANDPGWNARELAWIPLAIVQLSQGDRESATATLDRAEPFIASSLKSSAESSERVRNSPWFDAVEGAVLLAEARRLLLK